MPSKKGELRVAIVGGGLAGAALANALTKANHIDMHVYESDPEFSERGAAVALSGNTRRALDVVFPSSDALLDGAGAVTMNSSRLMLGSGPNAGVNIFEMASNGSDSSKVVHRGGLLREMLKSLPSHRLHPSKRVSAIKHGNNHVLEITFADGTTEQFDAVIGADGIFSTVRQYVIQEEEGSHNPSPAGFWDCRNLVTMERAKEVLGAAWFETPRQNAWMGDGGFILHDVLDNGETVQCYMSGIEENTTGARRRDLTKTFLEEKFSSWLGGPVADGMIKLMLDQPRPCYWSEWEQKSTPTYFRGNVCIMGDAAHATTPWQAAGVGQAMEDAMVLGNLLARSHTSEQIFAAFQAYDFVRRPRGQAIIDSSRNTGLIVCGQDPDVGLDPAKMKEALSPRWNFIMGLDTEGHIQDAVKKFEELLSNA